MFFIRNFQNGMWVGMSLPLSIIQVGFLKSKFSQEIISNGEKCGWLKQMWAADEKHDSNK